jgi:hypothetical protein
MDAAEASPVKERTQSFLHNVITTSQKKHGRKEGHKKVNVDAACTLRNTVNSALGCMRASQVKIAFQA